MQRINAQVMFKTVTVLLSLKIIVHPKNETSVIKKTNFLSLKLQKWTRRHHKISPYY